MSNSKTNTDQNSNVSKLDAEIMKLKKAHKIDKIFVIDIDGEVGFLKMPDKSTISKVLMLMADRELLGAGDLILNSCFLSGSQLLLTDDSYSIPAALKAIEVVEMRTASMIKK